MKSKKETITPPPPPRSQLLSFFRLALRLKSVKRAGWISKARISNAESVSDHTYSMCAMGMVLSALLGLNTERVAKMILIHDLAESIIGDYMPNEITKRKKRFVEGKAMHYILCQLPTTVRSDYEKTWQEYQVNKTSVARFVHNLDKLEMAIQAIEYINQGFPKKALLQFFASAKRSLSTKKIGNEDLYGKDIMLEILRDLETNVLGQSGPADRKL